LGAATLESESFTTSATFDALNRVTTTTAPDHPTTPSATTYGFDVGGMLKTVSIVVRGASTVTQIVTDIQYDAHGRRTEITQASGITTSYHYDPLTFRLSQLVSTRDSDSAKLQDLTYSLDPVGNVIAMADDVTTAVYFDDNYVDASTQYKYDPLYRLVW